MTRKHTTSLSFIAAAALATSAWGQVGVDADVSIGGGSVADADVSASIGDGGSVADADVNASVGGDGSVADAGVDASVGGGSVADAGVDATVGGGSVADADVGATVGGGSVADAGVDATVGGGTSGGGTGTGGTQTGNGGSQTAAGGTQTTGGNAPSLVGQNLYGSDGVRLGVVNSVTRNMICTKERCLDYSTRPVLTAEGVVVNVSSDVFLQ